MNTKKQVNPNDVFFFLKYEVGCNAAKYWRHSKHFTAFHLF